MHLLLRLITRGGVLAFFFFSYILMLLHNSVIAGQLGLAPALSYLQTAALWFLVSLFLAGVGVGRRSPLVLGRTSAGPEEGARRGEHEQASTNSGERIEARIERTFTCQTILDEDGATTRLEDAIERRILDRIRTWIR